MEVEDFKVQTSRGFKWRMRIWQKSGIEMEWSNPNEQVIFINCKIV